MKKYLRDQIERFLGAVDAALAEPATMVIIGGSAAVLRYGVTLATHDIDTINSLPEAVLRAAEKARESTGLSVPIQMSGVADPPYDYESRLERILPQFTRLSVWVPERHDLVLMKTMRADAHDLDAIVEIHSNAPLDFETLVGRFISEMDAAIGEPTRIRRNLLVVVERLFPELVEEAERRLAR